MKNSNMKNEEKLKEVLNGMDNEFYPNDFLDHVELMPLYVVMPFLNINCIFNPETCTWTKKVVAEYKTNEEILKDLLDGMPEEFRAGDFSKRIGLIPRPKIKEFLLANCVFNHIRGYWTKKVVAEIQQKTQKELYEEVFGELKDRFSKVFIRKEPPTAYELDQIEKNKLKAFINLKLGTPWNIEPTPEKPLETKLTPEAINQMLDSAFEKMPNRFCVMNFASLMPWTFLFSSSVDYLNKVAKIDNETNGMFYDKIEPKPKHEPMPPKPLETEIFAAINFLKSTGYVIYKSC